VGALQFLTASLVDSSEDNKIEHMELRWAYPAHPKIGQVSNFVLTRLALVSDEQQMIRRIKSDQYRHIRAAYQRGVSVEWGMDQEHLCTFYNLHLQTRRRLGVPVQPWSFFKKLGELIIKQGHGFILLAYKKQVCVAAAIFLHWNRRLTYKYSASIEEARYLQAMYPILWAAIRWGGERDFYELDLGRSDRDGHGLRTFKQRWGAEEYPLFYSVSSPPASRFLQKKLTPLMQYVIRKSPLWFCRLAGQLMYRYFS
jgi:lipid II:glycine glycyltransferase (peptidoglycan interpeptide bridge formation enzyme)